MELIRKKNSPFGFIARLQLKALNLKCNQMSVYSESEYSYIPNLFRNFYKSNHRVIILCHQNIIMSYNN